MTMVRTAITGAVLAATLSLAGCGRDEAARPKTAAAADATVAKVDGKPVLASEVKREAVAQGLVGAGEAFGPAQPRFRAVLEEIVDRKLLAAEAERRGLDRTPAGERALAAARERALGDLVVQAVVADNVTEAAVRGLYAEQQRLAPSPPATLEAARPQLVRFLTYDQIRDLLEKLRGDAKIELTDPAKKAAP